MAGTLLLTRRDVTALLSQEDCIAAVERAFRLRGEGRTSPPGVLGIHVEGGGFHVKAATLHAGRTYFAAKLNANFPGNRRFDLPTIQGVVALCDAKTGVLLALLDSIEITVLRTAAATAIATSHLALPHAAVLTICGCGNQGQASARAIARVRRLRTVFLWDLDPARAAVAAQQLQGLDVRVQVVDAWQDAAARSDLLVTCTPSTRPFVGEEHVRPGTFVAAVGADSAGKNEIDAALMAAAVVITDITAQCAEIGDLHHAIVEGRMSVDDVRAELGSVVAGRVAGRRDATEIVVFDSTGSALQDVAAAAVVYERAVANGRGIQVDLGR